MVAKAFFITRGTSEDVLYRNNGNGTFSNVHVTSGMEASKGYVTQGVSKCRYRLRRVARHDRYNHYPQNTARQIPRAENLVFINNQNSTFRHATTEYGFGTLQSFSTGISFGNINADGFPDEYIGNYFSGLCRPAEFHQRCHHVNASQTAKRYLLMDENGKAFSQTEYPKLIKFELLCINKS